MSLARILCILALFCPASLAFAQSGQIAGTVTDATSGDPLPGVNVTIPGTTHGTATGMDGSYTISGLEPGVYTVRASLVGYNAQEVTDVPVASGESTNLDFVLQEDVAMLEEIVVVGYGTQRKVNLTGAVDQVTSEILENRPMANLTQGLQGVMPNVNIRLLDGKPVEAPAINIRGTTSIGQGGSALVLIDGVEGDPSMLNPNDIESISVLKDASSAAIYGARGAFGVVLITTKRPRTDGFSITYGSSYSLKRPIAVPDFVTDGYTWAKMFNESFYNWQGSYPQNVNKTLPFSQQYLAELERRSKDPSLPDIEVGPDGQYVYYGSTDWYEHLYKSYTNAMEHNLSISRGNETTSFMVSGRYLGQGGLFRYNSDDYAMYNVRALGTVELYPWLRVENSFDFSSREYHNPLNVGEGGGIWRNIADEGHPLAPMLNPDGTLTYSAAYTVGDFYYGKNGIDTKRSVLKNTAGFQADVTGNFRIKGDASFQFTFGDQTRRRVPVPYSRAPGVIEFVGETTNDLQQVTDRINYYTANLYGEYENILGNNHYVSATIGTNYEQSAFERLVVSRNGLVFPDAKNINLALGQSIATSGGYQAWNVLGGFYRLNYIYDDRYLLEFNGRYDGSSKFPENERFAFFPSVSLGWRVSQESFWKLPESFISDLKIRASYGTLGNGNISPYAFEERLVLSQSGRIINGIRPQLTQAPSVLPAGLTWESSTTRNIGIDLEMISGRLQFTGDAYVRKTTDMYTRGLSLPAVFGAEAPRGNYADLKTTGWEIALTWRDAFNVGGKPLSYDARVTLSDYQSEILRYNNPEKFLDDYYVGMKVGEIWGYVTEGFFTSQEDIDNHADQSFLRSTNNRIYHPGDIKLRDLNGDGVIDQGLNTVDDPGDRKIIGNTTPRYSFGVQLGANWSNFSVSTFFQGVGKQDWYPSPEANHFWGQYNRPYNDIPKWHLKEGMIWSEENPDSFFPRYVSRIAHNSGGILWQKQTKYLMNAAYIRLKNVQVGYNLPANLTSRMGIRAARVYVAADNIWTWSPLYKIADNVDVENITAPSDQLFTGSNAGDGYNYPMLKSASIGVSITL